MPPSRRASWATWTERARWPATITCACARWPATITCACALFKAADSQLRDVNQKIKALERADIPTDEKRAQLDLLYRARNRLAAMADQHARAAR